MREVDAPEAHVSALQGIQALEEREERALAGAALPDDSRERAAANGEREVLEHRRPCAVAEGDALEVDVARVRGCELDAAASGVELEVQDLEEPVGGDERILDDAVDVHERGERTGEVPDDRVARHELTRRELLRQHGARADPEHGDGAQARHALRGVGGQDAVPTRAIDDSQQAHEPRFRLLADLPLEAEALDRPDGGERFDELRLEIGRTLHGGALRTSIGAVGEPQHQGVERDGREHDRGERPGVERQEHRGKGDDEHVHRDVERGLVDERADLHGVVHARDDLAHPHGVEESLGEAQQVTVVAEDERAVEMLPRAEEEQVPGDAELDLRREQEEHGDAHHVEQPRRLVRQDVVDDLLDVDGGHEREQRPGDGAREHAGGDEAVRRQQRPKAPGERRSLVARGERRRRRQEHDDARPAPSEVGGGPRDEASLRRIHHHRGAPIVPDEHHEVVPAAVERHVRDGGERHVGEAFAPAAYGLGVEAQSGGCGDESERARAVALG